jgi:transcriptional regulator with XRE-family HTH domain
MLELYANIKKYRLMRGMSQDELAQKTGYSNRSAIARIERGDIDLPQSKVIAFAEALRVSVDDLMGSDGTTDKKNVIGMDFGTTYAGAIPSNLLVYLTALNDEGIRKAEEYLADLADIERYKRKDGD